MRDIIYIFVLGSFAIMAHASYAGSATWSSTASNDDWNVARNWTPATVPNGPSDTATFDASRQTDVATSFDTEVSGVVFNPGAGAFTITAEGPLTISGLGVTNNSGVTQNFVSPPEWAHIIFRGSATAGASTVFTNKAPTYVGGIGAEMFLYDDSTAGDATIINEGSSQARSTGGYTMFFNNSSAANANIVNGAGSLAGGPGNTDFYDNASAGNAIVTNNGNVMRFYGTSTAADATFTNSGQDTAFPTEFTFFDSSTAGNALIVSNAGKDSSDLGARVEFDASSSAGNATLIANGGVGEGGHIDFYGASSGGTARIEVFGNGYLDISGHDVPGVTIGSLEGDGTVELGSNRLTVGKNNLDIDFTGVISGAGSLRKIGRGKLTLTGANTYTGRTVVRQGTLSIRDRSGSLTVIAGSVEVDGGTFGGSGLVNGAGVVSGNRNATLEADQLQGGNFIFDKSLTFKSGATYQVDVNSAGGRYSNVRATGITIEEGAVITIKDSGHGVFDPSILPVLIDTKGKPIAGEFSNLPNGGSITVGQNTYVAVYSPGYLTLWVNSN